MVQMILYGLQNIFYFTEQQKRFCLSLYYNAANSQIFVNSVEIYKFKVKDSQVKTALLCLGNVSKDFSVDNMKKTRLYGYIDDFPVAYDSIGDILDIHRYLMKNHNIKQC